MKRAKAAAKSRRVDPLPRLTLNLEIVGVALLAIAAYVALALWAPKSAGWFGPGLASTIGVWFGAAAWISVAGLVVVAIIIFLEIHVVRIMAFMAACAAGEFLALDAALGMSSRGGAAGNAIAWGLSHVFGAGGADIAIVFAIIAFVVAPTGVSMKKTMAAGAVWGAGAIARLRSAYGAIVAQSATAREADIEVSKLPAIRREPPQPERVDKAVMVEDPADVALAEIVPEAVVERPAATPVAERGMPEPVTTFEAVEKSAPPKPARAAATPRSDNGDAPMRLTPAGYRLPDFALFNPPEKRAHSETSAAKLLEDTLASFGVGVTVTHIERGPTVSRYELTPERGVKVSAIKALSDNIQLALAAQSVRIEAPIPGKAAVGVEVPNSAVSIVAIREILDYLPKGDNKLSIGFGKDITGRPIVADLGRMPHLLVAGATGAGKSVCLNVIIASLIATCTPDAVQLLLIDPKRVELIEYNGIPHLIRDCIVDPKLAAGALYELTKEMDTRYERFARAGVRKIEEYNLENPDDRMPYIVVVIDELADLMLVAPTRVETSICRIAQLARATGIHLVVATQRPSVDVITGLIKANIPSRIAFAVSSQVDSRTILDMAGAERLLGRGDMLFLPMDAPKPVRVQGALVTSAEIERLCEFWRAQDDPENRIEFEVDEVEEDGTGPADELAFDAAKVIVERQMASVALLQAELKIGHPRAVRLMKILEEYRVVGPSEGTKPRKILVGTGDVDTLATILAPRRSEQTLL
ncbi:MAG TPA: DNA translocase FtsK [Candidatus Eremiobacteraceae bacterium]|nr:DNA translocase FtsK [Candidatus Eremiobacteraceae bacterium]